MMGHREVSLSYNCVGSLLSFPPRNVEAGRLRLDTQLLNNQPIPNLAKEERLTFRAFRTHPNPSGDLTAADQWVDIFQEERISKYPIAARITVNGGSESAPA